MTNDDKQVENIRGACMKLMSTIGRDLSVLTDTGTIEQLKHVLCKEISTIQTLKGRTPNKPKRVYRKRKLQHELNQGHKKAKTNDT